MTLGMGLFVDLNRTSNWGKIAMYQIIAGAGCGPLFQGPLIAIHSVINQKDVATATASFSFLRNLASAAGVSLGLVVFTNNMEQQIPILRAQGISERAIALLSHGGASANIPGISDLPRTEEIAIRDAYAQGVKGMRWFFFAVAVVGGIASAFIGRHELQTTVKSNQPVKHKKQVVEKKSQDHEDDVDVDMDMDVEKGAVGEGEKV